MTATMSSTAPDRDQFIAEVQVAMEKHAPEPGGCICGFCAYSAEHAMIMAVREVWPRHFNVR